MRMSEAEGMSFRRIAEKLNQDGVTASRDAKWHPTSVYRLHNRFRELHLRVTL